MTSSWLRNGRLPDGRIVDIRVDDGLIGAVVEHAAQAESTAGDDLQGWLVLPAMAEPHAHLDKVLTAETVSNPAGDLDGAIAAWRAAAIAGRFTPDDVERRASTALEMLLAHGVTAVRTHVNVTPEVGVVNLHVLDRVGSAFAGLIDLQIVALTSAPVTGAAGAENRAILSAAIEAGVDIVGGCPHLDTDGAGGVAVAFDAAADAGLGIDLHTDETLDPGVLTLRDMARHVRDTGFEGLVAASHCVSLGVQPLTVQRAVAAEVAVAGIAVFPLPQTNLYLQGRDTSTATPRGLTALGPLHDAGALVAAGADNVQDPYNLVGRSDPLETAALLVMAGHRSPDEAYAMVSNNARRAMGLPVVSFAAGDPADVVAIDAPSIRGAIADAPMSRRVYRRGRLVASVDQETTVHR
ncbi:MAG: amidohydrolase family protein [Acidimicrobiia bacterium]|nr:amidohydrolase family protein [Acidimicrobiia bacterium]